MITNLRLTHTATAHGDVTDVPDILTNDHDRVPMRPDAILVEYSARPETGIAAWDVMRIVVGGRKRDAESKLTTRRGIRTILPIDGMPDWVRDFAHDHEPTKG